MIAPFGHIPVGESTWRAGVRCGRYPQPVRLGPRITAWRVAYIHARIERDAQPQRMGGEASLPDRENAGPAGI